MTAVTLAGVVTVTSDGVTVVREAAVLAGIDINDGEPCNMAGTQHYMKTMFNCNFSRLISVVCVMFEVGNELILYKLYFRHVMPTFTLTSSLFHVSLMVICLLLFMVCQFVAYAFSYYLSSVKHSLIKKWILHFK